MSEANQHLEVEVITVFQLLPSSYSVGERNILQTVLLQFFFSFYVLNDLQSDNDSNTVYVLA